jgi:hypothetical protein
MANPTVADLTVTEFKELVREAVSQSLTELLADPDEGMVLRDDFAEALRNSLSEVQAGGRTTSLSDVLKDVGTSK